MRKVCLSLMFVVCCGINFATLENLWTGDGDGISWQDADNWSLDHSPTYNTNHSEYSYIGKGATGSYTVNINQNLVNNSTRAYGGRAWLGRPEDPTGTYTLNILDSGEYYLVRLYIGPKGILNSSGLFDTWEGRFQDSEINITDGTFIIRSSAWAFFDTSSYSAPGITTISGGTLRIKNGATFCNDVSDLTSHNPEFTGVWDLCGGQVVMDGDVRTALQWHINNGNIIAYNDTANEDFIMTYDAGLNTTTLMAIPEPATLILLGLGGILTAKQRR